MTMTIQQFAIWCMQHADFTIEQCYAFNGSLNMNCIILKLCIPYNSIQRLLSKWITVMYEMNEEKLAAEEMTKTHARTVELPCFCLYAL